jgi:hypothetical protein
VELVAMVLLAFPFGYFIRPRLAAYVAYVGAFSFIFTFQTLSLLRAWVGGDRSAFAADPNSSEWSYAVVNLVFYAGGLGLVTLGHWVSERRRSRRALAKPLTASSESAV